MKKYLVCILVASLVVMGLISPVRAQMVSRSEALTLARQWIDVIIANEGHWGAEPSAEVADVQEFRRGDRVLGYFCRVRPRGYIIVSLRKELVPVKAYSTSDDLDPGLDEGMADLIKDGIEQVLDDIQRQLGPLEKVPSEEMITIISEDYRPLWAALEKGDPKINYQSGNELLTSSWHQKPPFNNDCPNMGCTWPPCYANNNAYVGCVATAGAQIMRYWNWPPYGEGSPYDDTYDWPNMPDRFIGCAWNAAEVNAVAELSREVGQAVGMSYGCGGSSANTYDMEGVYQDHYRYSNDCNKKDRNDYSDVNWWAWMKYHLNQNQPIHYRVAGHSIVSDGWREIGSPVLRQYHMNYGWDNGYNTWYSLDSLHLGGIDEEYMLADIYPEQAVRNTIAGTYLRESFPYRYFDQDATGESAIFESGQQLQFLPNIRVQCTSTTGGSIRIYGSSSYHTKLFTRGDKSVGVEITNGAIQLSQYGGIKFY